MVNMRCLNYEAKTNTCEALKKIACKDCKIAMTDPVMYLTRLQTIRQYSRENTQTVAKLNKRIKQVMIDYDIPSDFIPDKETAEYIGWKQVYAEDKHRGEGGGGSSDACPDGGLKQKMKDNRPQECKLTRQQRTDIKEALGQFEDEHGKLPKLSRALTTRTNIDSYTGDKIE